MTPDLRATYGATYRVTRDPAAGAWCELWAHVVPLRRGAGEVYVHSETHAGVEIDRRRRKLRARLVEAGHAVHIECDELTLHLIPWPDLPAVLPWLGPYRRRRLSDAQRASLAAASARFRFRGKTTTERAVPC